MGEFEAIHELLQLIGRLKKEREDLKNSLLEIWDKITDGRFFGSDSIYAVSQHLAQTEQIEADCKKNYAALYPEKELPDSVEELQEILEEAERNNEYKNSIALFLQFRLSDEKENEMLSVHKENLKMLGELRTPEDYKSRAGKYLDFISAYQETNPLQLVKYTQKLQGQFEDELISWIIFKKDEIEIVQEEDKKETQKKKAKKKKIEENRQEQNLQEKNAQEKEEQKKNTQSKDLQEKDTKEKDTKGKDVQEKDSKGKDVQKKDIHIQKENRQEELTAQEISGEIYPEEENCYQIMKEEGALRECKGKLEIFRSPRKEKKKFGVKEFKSDVGGPLEDLRKKILTETDSYGGVTIDYLEEIVQNTENGIILRECETLLNLGYLRKYAVSGMGELYVLSPRGCKAFFTKASAAFLGVGIKSEEPLAENEENAAVVKLLLFSLICYEFKNNGTKDMMVQHCSEEYFFISREKLNEEEDGPGIIYTALVTEKNDIGRYFAQLKEELEKEEYKEFVVAGINLEHSFQTAHAICRVFGEKISTECIYCYGFEEKEKIAFQEGAFPEKQTAVTKENEAGEEYTKEEQGEETDQTAQINKNYKKMLCADKVYCATAYLRAALENYSEFTPLYHKLAYAVNDPMEKCSYTSDKILNLYFNLYYKENSVSHEYFMVSALLRNYFNDHIGYDYHMQQLYDAAKGSTVFLNNDKLEKTAYELLEFKKELYSGIDKYAAYRSQDNIAWEAELAKITNQAKDYYSAYIANKSAEYAPHKRFLETRRIIFAPDGELGICLKAAADNDRELLPLVQDYLLRNYIKDKTIDAVNIEGEKIDEVMDKSWIEAAQYMRLVKKTSTLMSSLRMNLYKQILKIVTVLCDWVSLHENRGIEENDKGLARYKKTAGTLIEYISGAMEIEEENIRKNSKTSIGARVLLYTLKELKEKLDGSYQGQGKYFYVNFLKNNKVLLDTDFLPDMEYQISDLAGFSLTDRIARHAFEKETDMKERLAEIFDSGDDYGSAALIMEYLKETGAADDEEMSGYKIKESIEYARKNAVIKKNEFVENLELAQSYGQLENSSENKKEKMLQSVSEWYERTLTTNNFGFFASILVAYQSKIKQEARERETSIQRELNTYLELHEQKSEDIERIDKIRLMLAQQNYTVAEDLINRLINDETESELELLKTDYLQEFIDSYDYNYKSVSDSGKALRSINTARAKKDTKGGQRLLDSWMMNGGHLGEQRLAVFLENLGFLIAQVTEQKIINKIESYLVILKKPENGRKSNYKHPIAAFGSKATEDGFRVVCLYGKYDALRLTDVFKEIGNARHTIVLLDYALSLSDRRELARKAKMEVPEKIFGVIDRVLLMYLVNNYVETSINRMLMEIMMPYAYYQPYVVDSANIMPPEIFIGRKEELDKIESASGVNIVYGGRQLGKSALLSMAKNNINEDENGDRAVLVDIKGLDYEKAARKVSNALSDEGIFWEDYETGDWSQLARKIKQRLQDSADRIPYLLLLLDEADAFIESCEKVNYQPFDALKEVQSIGTDRFKFVVAGLRNIIRFKRDIALGNNSVLTHLDSVTVTPFNVMEAKELLQLPLFYLGFRFPEKEDALVSMILASTNYFPGLLQMYCAKLLEAMKKSDYAGYNESETPPYIIQEKHIKKVLSETGFQKSIREKFMITLKVDEDDYYYVIALLMAYLYHTRRDKNGYSPENIQRLGEEFHVEKIQKLTSEKTEALMEEMRELNVLRITAGNRYLFTRYSFFQMMGTRQQIEEEILKYMEGQNG